MQGAVLESKFYYKGKFFSSETEFWNEVKDFGKRSVNEDSFEILTKELVGNFGINLSMLPIKITNYQLQEIYEHLFIEFITVLDMMRDYDDKEKNTD